MTRHAVSGGIGVVSANFGRYRAAWGGTVRYQALSGGIGRHRAVVNGSGRCRAVSDDDDVQNSTL